MRRSLSLLCRQGICLLLAASYIVCLCAASLNAAPTVAEAGSIASLELLPRAENPHLSPDDPALEMCIRDSHTQVVPSAVASEGKWAIRVWPELGKKRLIRAWAGLRVMPDDSMAIYSRLPGHPNVTLVNTHSAVTMAAAHTRLLPDFILGGELPETAQGMTLKRFGYSC